MTRSKGAHVNYSIVVTNQLFMIDRNFDYSQLFANINRFFSNFDYSRILGDFFSNSINRFYKSKLFANNK